MQWYHWSTLAGFWDFCIQVPLLLLCFGDQWMTEMNKWNPSTVFFYYCKVNFTPLATKESKLSEKSLLLKTGSVFIADGVVLIWFYTQSIDLRVRNPVSIFLVWTPIQEQVCKKFSLSKFLFFLPILYFTLLTSCEFWLLICIQSRADLAGRLIDTLLRAVWFLWLLMNINCNLSIAQLCV